MTKRVKAQSAEPPRARYELAEALAVGGWAEADESLAQAIAALSQLTAEIETLDQASEKVHALSARALLVHQLLGAAARARGMRAFGEVGAIEKFDPALHETLREETAPERVRIMAQGVARGELAQRAVLVKALAEPEAPPRKAPAKKATTKKAAPDKKHAAKKRAPSTRPSTRKAKSDD